jgi:hypothetical protein
MNEDEDFRAEQAHLMDAEAERIRQEVEDAASDPAAQVEWIRQSNLIYGGLAGAGLVVVQPFLDRDLARPVCDGVRHCVRRLDTVARSAPGVESAGGVSASGEQVAVRRGGQGGRTSLGVCWRHGGFLAHLHRCGDRVPGRGVRRGGSALLGICAAGVRLRVPLEISSPQGARGVTNAIRHRRCRCGWRHRASCDQTHGCRGRWTRTSLSS